MSAVDWGAWAMVAGINLMVILTPGPDVAITMRTALARGIRAGLWTATGITCGLGVHVLYTLAGLSVLIAQSATLFGIVKILGAAWLIWLGVQGLRARPAEIVEGVAKDATTAPGAANPGRPRGAFVAGFLTNVLNPKVALYFLALFTQVLDPATSSAEKGLYGLTMMAQTLLIYGLLAALIGQPGPRRAYRRAAHWVERLLGLAFIGLGLRLALSRAQE